MQHSTNTSQITHMQVNDNTAPNGFVAADEPPTERNLPSEMKHRPKIPRTPSKAQRDKQAQQAIANNQIQLPPATKNAKPLSVRTILS